MNNTIDFYRDIGRRVAAARNKNDEVLAIFEMNFLRKNLNLEKIENKPEARKAYDEGFKSARNIPSVKLFL